jgi:predicted aminopeptidase
MFDAFAAPAVKVELWAVDFIDDEGVDDRLYYHDRAEAEYRADRLRSDGCEVYAVRKLSDRG